MCVSFDVASWLCGDFRLLSHFLLSLTAPVLRTQTCAENPNLSTDPVLGVFVCVCARVIYIYIYIYI